MLLARGDEAAAGKPGGSAGRLFLIGFFCVHYGIFWLGHGVFVWLILPTFAGTRSLGAVDVLLPAGTTFDFSPFEPALAAGPQGDVLVWGTLALLASHLVSFFLNYIGRREYLTRSITVQMFAPYTRVVVLHLTILFGALMTFLLGQPIAALVVLIVLKTALDLRLHLREHDTQPRPTRIEDPDRPH
jgi:hypothetical protein